MTTYHETRCPYCLKPLVIASSVSLRGTIDSSTAMPDSPMAAPPDVSDGRVGAAAPAQALSEEAMQKAAADEMRMLSEPVEIALHHALQAYHYNPSPETTARLDAALRLSNAVQARNIGRLRELGILKKEEVEHD